MAWFRLESSFRDHPKFKKLAALLGVEPVTARGHVATLWAWVVDSAADGDLRNYDAQDIALASDWPGDADEFLRAMLKAKLLTKNSHGLAVHEWMERAGSYKEARRKAKQRLKDDVPGQSGTIQDSPGQSGNVPQQRTDRQTDRTDLAFKKTPGSGDVLRHYLKLYPDRVLQADMPESHRVINARLAHYTPQQLMAAIDGNAADEWAQQKGLNSIKQIFGKVETVDKFIGLAKPKPDKSQPRGPWTNDLTGIANEP